MNKAVCLFIRFQITWILFSIITFFFLFSSPVYAALTITNISPTTVNKIDDTITISASASGLQNSAQYLQVLLTKEGETNYFGLTKNLKDEWNQYKSSPSSSDLASYFFTFTPINGTWFGDIQAKVDAADSGYKGPGNYTVKLAKYITSSASFSTNSMAIAVNIVLTPTPTITPIPTDAPTPTRTPTPMKTPTPTPKLNETSTSTPTTKVSPKTSPTNVLGESTTSATVQPTGTAVGKPTLATKVAGIQTQQDIVPVIFIGGGILLLISCGILFFQPQLKQLWKKE
jgi:hypothetical protein